MEDVFCQNLEWGLKLAVETDRHKKVAIYIGSRKLTPADNFPRSHTSA